jgi:secondary thiamine-phosphate synthase enzyme
MLITIKTNSKTEMVDITDKVQESVQSNGISNGICLVYVPHTTAAVTINENADPTVKSDILGMLNTIVPWQADYRHLEGNAAAHIKSTIVGASEFIGVENGRLVLGTWQGIFFCEFDGPRTRKVHLQFIAG